MAMTLADGPRLASGPARRGLARDATPREARPDAVARGRPDVLTTPMRAGVESDHRAVWPGRAMRTGTVHGSATRASPGKEADVSAKVDRYTVDLTDHSELVVIYLGMRVREPRGLRTLLGFGRRIREAVAASPDGLLLHEDLLFSFLPPHAGMRQYWRDFDSLERWARSGVHKEWWRGYVHDTAGTGFWHETYFQDGTMEAVFLDMPPVGIARVAPTVPARGSMFSARRRHGLRPDAEIPSAVVEEELYRAS
jgi:Domain of unknown function (DUF4188)